MIFLKFLKTKFFIFLFSIFILVVFLIVLKPILTAKDVIFPYSIHPFNIAKVYPKVWFYIKIIYCLNLFVVIFLISNSIISFLKINKKSNCANNPQTNDIELSNPFKLLVGINQKNKKKLFIPEKGLYQNILITGTIGSRQNKFRNVSLFKAVNGMFRP